MLLALLALLLIAVVLALALAIPVVDGWRKSHAARRAARRHDLPLIYDPGRERRAEQRARELLRSCLNDEEWAMYRDLGFIRVRGRHTDREPNEARPGARGPEDAQRLPDGAGGHDARRQPSYAYLVYPHKPIVAYLPESGQLLSEYCVRFPDLTGGQGRTRLPASDDVLAKWMALTSDEERLIDRANMHLVGRQLDPARVRRDLWRLAEWQHRRDGRSSAGAGRA